MHNSHLKDPAKQDPALAHAASEESFIEKVEYLIRQNLSNNYFGATELARYMGISSSQLNRRLNHCIGFTAGKLIREMRMAQAYKLLTETHLPLKLISLQVGYIEQANFTRAFTNTYKTAPKSLRELKKKAN